MLVLTIISELFQIYVVSDLFVRAYSNNRVFTLSDEIVVFYILSVITISILVALHKGKRLSKLTLPLLIIAAVLLAVFILFHLTGGICDSYKLSECTSAI